MKLSSNVANHQSNYDRETAAIAKLTETGKTHLQVGALPLRWDADLKTQVLLITSRATRRWTIPRGWPMKGKKDHKAAEREAVEEAGVVGRIAKDPVGAYDYWKRGETAFFLCKVTVYQLDVERQLSSWREKGQRDTKWFSIAEAAALIEEPGLRLIIERLRALPAVN